MFERVLVPTDLSGYSHAMIGCIGSIPGIEEVALLHVQEPAESVPGAEAMLLGEMQELQLSGLSVSPILAPPPRDSVADEILRTAAERKSSLIIIGARGKGIVEELLLGSVSSSVVRHAPTSVLVMRHRVVETLEGVRFEKFCPRLFSRVLVPTDLSGESAGPLTDLLDGIAGIETVILAHVVTRAGAAELAQASVEDAELALDRLCADLAAEGIRAERRVRAGNPTHEIARLAEEEDVSLILVSLHGRNGLRRAILGSTAYSITEMAARPVLVARQTGWE
ncbi:MAG: universal stress protein [Methanomicrobiaceae archaeon]|nr:universal stress protein [Methanomicrobiaceae archaeon]